MSFTANPKYTLLLSRLTWPSPLVQERACRSLASLLRDTEMRGETWEHLSHWLRTQPLEICSVAGLMVLARAAIDEELASSTLSSQNTQADTSWLPAIKEVVEALGSPSLLSWLVLRDVYNKPELELHQSVSGGAALHSGEPPSDFKLSAFFLDHRTECVPPVYDRLVQMVTDDGINLMRQWAFEWKNLIDRTGMERSTTSLHFWLRGSYSKEHYPMGLPRMGEVYRSAFLRALAWAYETQRFALGDAVSFAAMLRPVDLELWRTEPASRPIWWPYARENTVKLNPQNEPATEPIPSSSPIVLNCAPTEVWDQVESLWNRAAQFQADSSLVPEEDHAAAGEYGQQPEHLQQNNWQLIAARAPVVQGETLYLLEIFGVFQRCNGPKSPSLEEVATWIGGGVELSESMDSQNTLTCVTGPQAFGSDGSPLRFRGLISPEDPDERAQTFDDWDLLPATCPVSIWASLPWQFWRTRGMIWFPAPYLSPQTLQGDPLHFEGHKDAFVIQAGDEVVGRWSDWTDGLKETIHGDFPSANGQKLLVPRHLIREIERETQANFCWICRLTGHFRDNSRGELKTFSECRAYGSSLITRPQRL